MADDLTVTEKPPETVVDTKDAPAAPVADTKAAPVIGADTGGDKGESKPDGTGTLLDGADKAIEGKSAPAGQWPENWRQDIAGTLGLTDQKEIDKEITRLGRMKSPADIYKMARELERKLSSGEVKKALPKDATDEQKAEWRKENGIPEKPDGYVLPEVKGFEWSDDDKAVASELFGAMHASELPQSAADAVLKWYPTFAQKQREQFVQTNAAAREQTEETLRKEFGAEYRPNLKLLGRLFQDTASMPESVSRALTTATFADGRILLNDPQIASYFIGLARQQYGDGAILTGDQEATLSGREEELLNIRNTNIDRFNSEKNAKGELLSDELLNIRRAKARSAR